MGNKQYFSVLGFYNYDNTLFSNMEVPEDVDLQLAIDNILMDNAELSLIYNDFDLMKYIIGVWSRSELDIWDRLNKAFNEEYNPIWNVDENTTETRNISRSGNESSSNSGKSNTTETNTNESSESSGQKEVIDKSITGSVTENETTETSETITDASSRNVNNTTGSTTINSVKGFNSNTWAEHDKSAVDGSETSSETGSNTRNSEGEGSRNLSRSTTENEDATNTIEASKNIESNGSANSNTTTSGSNESEHEENITDTFTRRRGGNIGVTMSQQLLEAELNVRPKLNIYKYISNSFKKRFCNMIY